MASMMIWNRNLETTLDNTVKPTFDDIMRFYCSQMTHGTDNVAFEVRRELSKTVYDV